MHRSKQPWVCQTLLLVTVILVGCSSNPDGGSPTTPPPTPSVAPSAPSPTPPQEEPNENLPGGETLDRLTSLPLEAFLEESYTSLLVRQPQFLTSLGVASQYGLRNDRLDDLSAGYLAETQRLEEGILNLLRQYDRNSLSPQSRISYDVYEWWLALQVDGHPFADHDYPVHHFVNSYNDNLLLFLTEEHPLANRDDANDYLSRLAQIDNQVAQLIEGLHRREELGNIPADFIVTMTINRLKDDLKGAGSVSTARPATLPLYTTFRDRLEGLNGLSDDEQQALLDEALRLVTDSFVPAWLSLIEHLRSIQPVAGPDPGVWRLPDGDAYYQHLLHEMTSTDLTAREIHQIGLEQVDRVQSELRAAFGALGYPEDIPIPDLLGKAAVDAGFLNGSSAAGQQKVVAAWEKLIDDIQAELGPYFSHGPSAGVVVVAEEFGAGGYYVAAAVDGSRPGSFHAGVAGSSIPTYIMPTIAYHEAIPGHHQQIALAQVLDLPTFRRFNQYNGYAEGWALYAERLAEEMGMYEADPYGNIGRLELELVRAVRLVADTGIHSLEWTRQAAKDYMTSIVGWSHEVERYSVLPGQATGYMIGQQEILRLRQDAMEVLGDAFDFATFHDVVLGAGSVPLEVLAETVGLWLGNEIAP